MVKMIWDSREELVSQVTGRLSPTRHPVGQLGFLVATPNFHFGASVPDPRLYLIQMTFSDISPAFMSASFPIDHNFIASTVDRNPITD